MEYRTYADGRLECRDPGGGWREWKPNITADRPVAFMFDGVPMVGKWVYHKEMVPFQREEISREEFEQLRAEQFSGEQTRVEQ